VSNPPGSLTNTARNADYKLWTALVLGRQNTVGFDRKGTQPAKNMLQQSLIFSLGHSPSLHLLEQNRPDRQELITA